MSQPPTSTASSRAAMFLLGATLALGFTLSAYILSGAVVRMRHEHTIKVKGTAETTVESDMANWKAQYTVRDRLLANAYAELETNQGHVQTFLTAAQTSEAECHYSAINVKTQHKLDTNGNSTNEVEYYILTQSVDVKSTDVARIDKLSKSITQLIKNGIEIHSFPPEFVCLTVDKIKLKLLGEATKNAYERAATLANNSHGKVGALHSASQGVFQITPVDSTEVTDYGSYDTSTISKSVKAVVTLEFNIEK